MQTISDDFFKDLREIVYFLEKTLGGLNNGNKM